MFDPAKIKSHPGLRTDLFPYNLSETLVTDFFGGVSQIEVAEGDAVTRIVNEPHTRGLRDSLLAGPDVRSDDGFQANAPTAPSPAVQSHRMESGSTMVGGSAWISLLALLAAGWLVWRVQRRTKA
jgi:hypothetical protein